MANFIYETIKARRKIKIIYFYLFLFSLFSSLACAKQSLETIQLAQEIKKTDVAFYDFLKNIRCVTCQNQTLAESNAPVAETMRLEIHDLWLQNKSTDDIKIILSERYGEFVLYEPHFSLKTAILWVGPFLFLLWGFLILRKHIK